MALRLYIFIFMVFLYGPILLLPVFAFNDGTVIAFPLEGFTWRCCKALEFRPIPTQNRRRRFPA